MVGLRVGTAAVDHSTYSAMQVGKQNAMIGFLHLESDMRVACCVDGVDDDCMTADCRSLRSAPVLHCSFSAATGQLSDEKNQWVANTGGNTSTIGTTYHSLK